MRNARRLILLVAFPLASGACQGLGTPDHGNVVVLDAPMAYVPAEPVGAPARNCDACEEVRASAEYGCMAWHVHGYDHPRAIAALDELAERWRNEAEDYGPNSERALALREELVIAYEGAQAQHRNGVGSGTAVARLQRLLK